MSCQFSDDDYVSDSDYDSAQDNDSSGQEVSKEEDLAVNVSEEVSVEEGKAENDHDKDVVTTTVSRQSSANLETKLLLH